jgi:transposase-like protein
LVHGVSQGGTPHKRPKSAPFDERIVEMRSQGARLLEIARTIGKGHPYVLSRLMRVARQREWDDVHRN